MKTYVKVIVGEGGTDGTPQTPERDSAAATLTSSNKDSTLKRRLGGLKINKQKSNHATSRNSSNATRDILQAPT